MCVNYGGRAEIADAARSAGRARRSRHARPEPGRRADARPLPRRARPARRGPVLAHVGGAADLELHALAGGVRRAGVQRVAWPDVDRRHLWAAVEEYARRTRRYGWPEPHRSSGDVVVGRLMRPEDRRGGRRLTRISGGMAVGRLIRPEIGGRCGGGGTLVAQVAQVPKTSSVCETSRKPCCPATVSAHRSTAAPSTSTVRPQTRQTRWWWWPAAAAAVERLAVVRAQHVDLTGIGQALQRAVHRRQPDAVAACPHHLVDLLRAAEVVQLGQRGAHGQALPGRAVTGRDRVGRGVRVPRVGRASSVTSVGQCSS